MPWQSRRYPRGDTHWFDRRTGDDVSGAASGARGYDSFRLILNVEQLPDRENRVVLGGRNDPLGMRAAELHWRWRHEDRARLGRARTTVARELEACGLGRVELAARPPDPNAHHQAGTTRMSLDARSGVVDPSGRVHGTSNLYVCGASVFPTVGFANPTLTVVALALRLASHLGATHRDEAPSARTTPSTEG